MAHPQKNPGIGRIDVIVPVIGQFYNGDFLRRIFWLIVMPGFWIGRAACPGGCVTSPLR